MTTTNYTVTGMTCGHCEGAIRSEVTQIPGVESLEVSAANGTLSVTTAAPVDDQLILAAVDEAGYSATRSS